MRLHLRVPNPIYYLERFDIPLHWQEHIVLETAYMKEMRERPRDEHDFLPFNSDEMAEHLLQVRPQSIGGPRGGDARAVDKTLQFANRFESLQQKITSHHLVGRVIR